MGEMGSEQGTGRYLHFQIEEEMEVSELHGNSGRVYR
jgi:hypothetical protein